MLRSGCSVNVEMKRFTLPISIQLSACPLPERGIGSVLATEQGVDLEWDQVPQTDGDPAAPGPVTK